VKTFYRRQRRQYLFVGVIGVLAVVNLLFFLILHRPARSEYSRLQETTEKLRVEVASQQLNVERLEKLNAQLETSEHDKRRLFTGHFLMRDSGYSQILPKLEGIAQGAGVRTTRKDYNIDEAPQYGLYSVKITIPVTGGYSNIIEFMKSLENSNVFFIINSIDVRGAAGASGGDHSLALNLETFFYQ
jgi:Tfp pilus assembly protein PilO